MAEYNDLLQGKNRGHYVISHYVIKTHHICTEKTPLPIKIYYI